MKPGIHPNYRTVVFTIPVRTLISPSDQLSRHRELLNAMDRPILMSHWISLRPRIRITPVNKKSFQKKAVLHASISDSAAS